MQINTKFTFPLFCFALLHLNCSGSLDEKQNSRTEKTNPVQTKEKIDTLELRLIQAGLIDVQSLNPKIQVDLKYSSEDNFMRTNVYGSLKKAFLQPMAAEKTAHAQSILDSIKPGYVLLIYDAVRPRWVQKKMWQIMDSIPPLKREKFVSNPAKGSLHNFGCAVDVTIMDPNGKVLDMGAGYDDPREIAYPSLEHKFLATGALNVQQIENRRLLRKVMGAAGFKGIPSEWWHFNALPLKEAKKKFTILE